MKPKITLKSVLLSWVRLAILMAIFSGTSWIVINVAIKPILVEIGG